MAEVFISYKAEDRRRVQPLVEALQADGLSVWWDAHIGGGDEWRRTIEQHLDAAACVLVVWSKRSAGPEGVFVRDEAARAQRRGTYLPVRIDRVHPPLGFGESQALPLIGWRGNRADARYQSVLGAVRAMMTGEPHRGVGTHQDDRGISRRAVMAAGAGAAAAAAGVGGWILLKPDSAAAADSIAVLPFANLSGDPAQAYFSDGIAEELRSALARVTGLKVAGRTSSEAVRDADAETAARKLGVANVLTGSVRRSPSMIRVSAELIDGKTGLQRWSEDYDRSPGDAIRIQSDIAQNVARSLSIALGNAARAALAAGGTDSVEAQNLALKANELSYRGSRAGLERALELLDAAIAIDPDYARAIGLRAILGLIYINQFAAGAAELARGRERALSDAKRALRLEPNLAIGHGALAEYYRSILQIRAAGEEYRRTVALAPGDPDALRSYSSFLSRLGHASEAIELSNEALALDRLNSFSYGHRIRVLYDARRYAEGVTLAEELKRNSPELFDHPTTLGDCLLMLGRMEEAKRSYAEESPDDPFRLTGEAVIAARTGDRDSALRRTAQIERHYGDAASYQYAQIHAQLGDRNRAFAALNRAYEIKDGGLLSLRVDPWLDPLRSDPRFTALVKKLDFPPA
jgi:TolB-like protein/Tfp pilus assembly protein PilF